MIGYHLAWIDMVDTILATGPAPTSIRGEIWACNVDGTAIIGAPGEIFSEIGFDVRQRSPFDVTLFAGYSQGVLGYVSTEAQCAFGGYEPAVAYRGYQQPGPFAPHADQVLADACVALLHELLDS